MNLRVALEHHLRFNHYPPVHLSYLPAAQAAIEAINEWRFDVFDMSSIDEHTIELPNGLMTSPRELADQLHLWDFVDQPEATDG